MMEAQQTTETHEPIPPEQGRIEPPRYEAPRYSRVPPGGKNPILAAVLSLVPGLGQIYVGYYRLGFIHALVVGFCFMIANLSAPEPRPFVGFFLPFFWLYNIVDAARRAALVNTALEGGRTPDLPDDIRLPRMGGSITGGIVLILGGLLLLSHTIAGVPLAWIADWWPVAPVAIGVWLLWRGLQEKKEADARSPATEPAEDSAP